MVEYAEAREWLKWVVGREVVENLEMSFNTRALSELIVLSNLLMASFRYCLAELKPDRFFSQ
jgi:hypothetical protein